MEEHGILLAMIAYLHHDPTMLTNNILLQFLVNDWKTLQPTLHTAATLDRLKSSLLHMGIPYLKYQALPACWSMWNDYSPDGILRFHRQDLGLNEQASLLVYTNQL